MDVLNRQRACEQLFLLSPLNSDTSPFFVNRKMIWYRKWVGARRCQHWRKYHLLTSYFRFYWMLFLKTHQLSLRSIERFYIFCFQLNIDCLFLVFWSWRFNIFFTLRKVQIIPFFFFQIELVSLTFSLSNPFKYCWRKQSMKTENCWVDRSVLCLCYIWSHARTHSCQISDTHKKSKVLVRVYSDTFFPSFSSWL